MSLIDHGRKADRATDANEARARRVEIYARWLRDDADGLAFTLAYPKDRPFPQSTAILAEARALVALTLSRLDKAIEADRAAHAQQEHAQ